MHRKKSPLCRIMIISNQETCKRLVRRRNSLCHVLSFIAKSTHQCTDTHPFKRILGRKLVSHFFQVQPHFLKGVFKVPPRVTNFLALMPLQSKWLCLLVVLSSSGEEGEDVLESPPAIRENITLQASEKPPTLTHPPIAQIGLNRKKNRHSTL